MSVNYFNFYKKSEYFGYFVSIEGDYEKAREVMKRTFGPGGWLSHFTENAWKEVPMTVKAPKGQLGAGLNIEGLSPSINLTEKCELWFENIKDCLADPHKNAEAVLGEIINAVEETPLPDPVEEGLGEGEGEGFNDNGQTLPSEPTGNDRESGDNISGEGDDIKTDTSIEEALGLNPGLVDGAGKPIPVVEVLDVVTDYFLDA